MAVESSQEIAQHGSHFPRRERGQLLEEFGQVVAGETCQRRHFVENLQHG